MLGQETLLGEDQARGEFRALLCGREALELRALLPIYRHRKD
jgi:hypothetical protein